MQIIWIMDIFLTDFEINRLYFVDAKLHQLASIDVSSPDKPVFSIVLISRIHLRHPFAVSVFEDNLYWTDWNTESLYRANKFNASQSSVSTVATGLYSPMDLHVYHR